MDTKVRMRYVLLILFVLLIVLIAVVYNKFGASKGQRMGQSTAMRVEVMEVRKERIPDALSFTGDLQPKQRAVITAKVSGLIEKMHVQEGDYAEEGQVLAKIEQDDYMLALQAAEATMAEAAASLELAKKDHERFSQLMEKGVIAQQRYDQVKAAYQLAQARYQSAKAALKHAQNQLANTRIKAPFSGFVTARLKDEGEQVRGGLPGAEAALVQMDDISLVRATGFLPEREINAVKEGMDADVTVDALPDTSFTGKVIVANPFIDPSTRTFMVKVEIPNEDFALKGNMFARVTIVKGYRETLTIPREAVLREEGVWLYHCFVVDAEGKAQRKVIKPIFTPFEYVEIEEGLTAGERIVIKGQHLLQGGEAVEIRGEGNEAS
jgi:membrane fusion protein (multidrug efflux system)